MQCNKCGSPMPDGQRFCTECGAEQILKQTDSEVDLQKVYCVNCGELIENSNFCTNCGTKLNENVNVESKDEDKKKKAHKGKKPIIILIACLVVVLGIGGYFGINQLIDALSGDIDDVGIPEATGSVVVDCSDIYEKVTNEESAYAVLNSVSELFGFENAKDVLDIQKTDFVNGDTYYRFAQKHKGIPVYGKSVVLSADEYGNVFNVSGNYMAIDDTLNTEPKLKADKAKKKIEKQIKQKIKKELIVSEPELVIYCTLDGSELAWVSSVAGYTNEDEFKGYNVFVNSDSGKVIAMVNTVVDIQTQKTFKGQNGKSNSVTVEEFETTDGNINYQLKDDMRNITVHIANDNYYWYQDIVDGKKANSLVCWKNNEEPDRSAVDAMTNVSKSYDFYNDVLTHRGMDGNGGEIPVYVHIKGLGYEDDGSNVEEDKVNNAFFWAYPEPHVLAFTIKTDETNEYSENLDVVGHEYTHGVVYDISGISGSNESAYERAINEAYADIMGILVEGKNSSNIPDWNIGGLRDIRNPSNNGYPTNMSQYDISKQAYYNSSIISHAAYQMWEGIDGNGAINDIDTLAKLWYGSLYMLTPDSDFSNCRTAVEISAERLLERGILSEEQVKCVSLAFNKVGIGESVTYDVVALNPELHVYAANNSEYYNYHYKVEKISVNNLYTVGKAVETDIKIVEEGDVTEEKTVNLSSLNQDSSHKCAYRITISDLSDEPGEIQSKLVVVSDAQDAKGILSFYTEYVPPVGEILEKVNSALDSVKSVHLSQNTTSNYTVMGSKVNMGISLESDINLTNGIMHTNMITKYGGRNINNDIYIKTSGSTSDIYMSTSGMWVKQTGISASDLYKLGSGFEGIDGIKFYLNSMENVYLESDSDEQNHIISGVIGSKATEEALKKAGLSTLIDQLDDSDEISKSDIQNMLSNLAPMKVTFLISKDTFLPAQMTIDMKDTTESIYSNMKSIAAKYGESISYSISTNKAVTDFTKYNGLSEIFIPEEAFNGTDYKIVK